MASVKKNYAYNIFYQILNMILPLITAPYVARIIGVDGLGVNTFTYSVVSYFMMVCILGLNNYGNREVSKNRTNKEIRSRLFSEIYSMQLLFSVLSLIAYLLFLFSFYPKDYFLYGMISVIYIISSMLDINWFFFGMENFKITVTRNCIIRVLTVILTFIIVRSKNDLWKYVLLLSLSTLTTQIVLWFFLNKYVSFRLVSFKDFAKHIRPNLILFLPILAISLYEVMDKIMLGSLKGVIQTGYYEAANKIVKIPQTLFASLGTVMLPRISSMVGISEERVTEYTRDSMQFVMVLAFPIMFGIMSIAERFVPIFYGAGYEESVTPLIVMSVVLLFSPWKSVLRTQCLIPRGKDKSYVISVFLGAIINLIINTLLIPKYGAMGAVWGTISAEVIVCIYQTYAVSKIQSVSTYFSDNWPFAICGVLMYTILTFIIKPLLSNSLSGLILLIISGAFIYLLIFIILYRLIKPDRFRHMIISIIPIKKG